MIRAARFSLNLVRYYPPMSAHGPSTLTSDNLQTSFVTDLQLFSTARRVLTLRNEVT